MRTYSRLRSVGIWFIGGLVAIGVAFAVPVGAQADTLSVRKEYFAALDKEKNFGPYEIEADARFGRVVLSGIVASEKSRVRAEEIARSVKGVKEVVNNLTVSEALAQSSHAGASPLAEAVREAVLARNDLGSLRLSVTARGDEITLEGTVASDRDRGEIEKTARGVNGVSQVVNLVQVQQRMTDEEITASVMDALVAKSDITVEGLSVSTKDGVVTIRGTRADHRERDRILSIALNVKGVKDIKSELR